MELGRYGPNEQGAGPNVIFSAVADRVYPIYVICIEDVRSRASDTRLHVHQWF